MKKYGMKNKAMEEENAKLRQLVFKYSNGIVLSFDDMLEVKRYNDNYNSNGEFEDFSFNAYGIIPVIYTEFCMLLTPFFLIHFLMKLFK